MTTMKGQFALTNIIGVFIGLIVLLLVAFPILNPLLADAVTNLPNNAYKPIMTAILYLVPLFMLLAVVVTIFRYATASQQPPGGYYR